MVGILQKAAGLGVFFIIASALVIGSGLSGTVTLIMGFCPGEKSLSELTVSNLASYVSFGIFTLFVFGDRGTSLRQIGGSSFIFFFRSSISIPLYVKKFEILKCHSL